MSTQVEAGEASDFGDPFGPNPRDLLAPGRVLASLGNAQEPRWRPGERLQHLFEDRCDAMRRTGRGDHLAVAAGDVGLTYDELDARANRLARYLLARGARSGDRIALLFDQAVHSYIGMLAVLKINAAYVPLDVGFPPDRTSFILSDAGVRMVLSLSHLRGRLDSPGVCICLDEAQASVTAEPSHRLTPKETGAPVDELCYIIYTSGSTGRPKGVAVEHASICNFVRVAAEVYGYQSSDRVYQGMTIAFDFAVEEIWVPLVAGATLVPKPGGTSLLGPDLQEFLQDQRVTALCCVPTLLATLTDELPQLRFLLVSGEACPRDLIARWHRPERRFLNVYGPTEATVTATWTPVNPDGPVTIGVPLPTYSVVILHATENQALLPGELGEIGIAGIGLARGYVNRDDLTDRAFIPDFIGIAANPSGRIYRTGDLGRVNVDGEIEYHGRIDTQVKIRGYRVELAEIESVLLEVPGILQAVVDTYQPEPGLVELVAYYSLRTDTAGLDEARTYALLRERLPGYMVPAYLEHLAVVPMLPSDKADRKNLPAPTGSRALVTQRPYVAPASDTEQILADALARVLRVERVSIDDHFFDDLGANSLLMATFCARARERTGRPMAMQDVYQQPTIATLAALVGAAVPLGAGAGAVAGEAGEALAVGHAAVGTGPPPARATTAQYVVCGALQLLMFLGSTYLAAVILVTGFEWVSASTGWISIYLRSVAFGAASFVLLSICPILAKWLLVGRWRPQEIPVWSLRYFRFWTVKALIRSNPLVLFVGSPLYVLYLRALGAKIGPGVTILSPVVPVCTDLLTIGAGTIIRKDAAFACYRAHDGVIQTGSVTLGRDVLIGEATVLDIDTSMGDGAQLGHASCLDASQAVPAGQRWHGSPARVTEVDYRAVDPAPCGTMRRVLYSVVQLVNRLVLFVPAGVGLAALLLPDYLASGHLAHSGASFYLDLLAVSFVLFFVGVLTAFMSVLTIPRLLNRALVPDRVYPLYGFYYFLQRMISGMTNLHFFMELTGDSSLIVHYLRLLGYDMPGVVQTGSNFGVALKHESPYLSTIGSGTMVSDGLSIINAEFSSTSFRVTRASIGSRNFFGNNVVYPAGAKTGDNCLFATKVMVPMDGEIREGVGLLGSPSFEIPRSVQRDSAFDAFKTGDELRLRLAGKNRHNAMTIALFLFTRWMFLFTTLLFASLALALYGSFGALAVAATLVVMTVFTVAYFVVIERASLAFRSLSPLFCSIYEPAFWRHERFWKLSAVSYLGTFNGTPFKNLIWRLLGVRIGKRVFDDGCAIPEKSLVSIGDDCTLNALSTIQCHSMEDGAFKVDGITIGAGCTLGVNAFVHYGVTMGRGAVLTADSFLMKGEEVAPYIRFGGNPARELPSAATEPARGGLHRWRPARRRGGRHRVPGLRGTASHPPTSVLAARSLLSDLRAKSPPLTHVAGVGISLFRLAECERRERELVGFLSDEEERESRSFSSRERRRDFVASRALVRVLLSADWRDTVAPRDWRIGHTDLGKLTVHGPAGENGIDVSISHSDRALAIAVSDAFDVGVDLEPSRRRGQDPVVWSALSAAEQKTLVGRPAVDRSSRFLRMWTLKEAYAKCSGAGSSLSFADLHTSFDPLAVTPSGDQSAAARYRFHQQEWSLERDRHWVAIAVASRPSG